MSETMGCDERMNDSLQHVHSWKWNHTTGRRAFASRALTTLVTPDASMPAAAASQLQNCRKSRREYPRIRACSQMLNGPPLMVSSLNRATGCHPHRWSARVAGPVVLLRANALDRDGPADHDAVSQMDVGDAAGRDVHDRARLEHDLGPALARLLEDLHDLTLQRERLRRARLVGHLCSLSWMR